MKRKLIYLGSIGLLFLCFYHVYKFNLTLKLVSGAGSADAAEVERLIRAGANVSGHDLKGMSALEWACYHGNDEVVGVLIRNHADPQTAISQAVMTRRPSTCKILFLAGASLTPELKKDLEGDTHPAAHAILSTAQQLSPQ